jgi:hypothetical protein
MSDSFFTKSGGSPGDADSTRLSSQRPPQNKPVKRAFTGMAGSPLARVEEPVAAAPAPKRRGCPPKHGAPMTPAERKRRERALAPLVEEQKRDDRSGGIYGPGHAVKGSRMDAAIAVAEKKWGIAEDGEGYYDEAKYGRVVTWYSDKEGVTSASEVPEDRKEMQSTFQKRHPIKKNWTYDERDRAEMARENAGEFITDVFIENLLVWDAEAKEFSDVDTFQEHRCEICGRGFWFWGSAVQHIVDSIDLDEGDETHRRRVLKGVGRGPARIPRVDTRVREWLAEQERLAEVASRAAGWVKIKDQWVRP